MQQWGVPSEARPVRSQGPCSKSPRRVLYLRALRSLRTSWAPSTVAPSHHHTRHTAWQWYEY